MNEITILVPEIPDEPPIGIDLAPRPQSRTGLRITLIDNGKPKARELLSFIADEMRRRIDVADVNHFGKGAATRIIDDQEVAAIAAAADVVISGLGDCGACSACSLGDALRMEEAGVPSTVVISDVFMGHVAAFAVAMGLPGYHSAVVPHPVSTKSDLQLASYAAGVIDRVIEQVTAPAVASATAELASDHKA